MFQAAKRIANITPSNTLAITAKANKMKADGIDVISLGAGEPDFPTPERIVRRAYEAMVAGETRYTPSDGLSKLKKVIIQNMMEDQQLRYQEDEIIVTTGAKFALYTLFQVLLNEGDEVIIPAPYWVSYPEQVKLAGGVPVIVNTKEENLYKITKQEVASAITGKTKAIIINSPNNPTGSIYSEEELAEIATICIENNVLIISDDIYEKLVYNGAIFFPIAKLSEEIKKQTIIINGVSKSFAMTGFRIGFAAGKKEIIKKMTVLASHSTSNPTTPAQFAAIQAYEGERVFIETMRANYESRLNIIYEQLLRIPYINCVKPQGAFYLFPNVKETASKCGFATVNDFVHALLEEALVAVIPGSDFGAPDHMRLSIATSLEKLELAIARIKEFVEKRITAY